MLGESPEFSCPVSLMPTRSEKGGLPMGSWEMLGSGFLGADPPLGRAASGAPRPPDAFGSPQPQRFWLRDRAQGVSVIPIPIPRAGPERETSRDVCPPPPGEPSTHPGCAVSAPLRFVFPPLRPPFSWQRNKPASEKNPCQPSELWATAGIGGHRGGLRTRFGGRRGSRRRCPHPDIAQGWARRCRRHL